ncbi:methyl-accepting chemotaxis protein [Bacillus pakistanensis]|uniref:Methyl-accepting chemotaxis protein n=2 Tax=Rossellomorea pakistanensis TaxID=992288 RepID=A0ABS2NBQ7_9BACI|nr:HAMP domain-containing methyl-accepting chemotaxis protein [Bacillus pakistanensis]MBM7585249.1 methyl-accepting chemotaxis protein [Bacillus pakistanensis]
MADKKKYTFGLRKKLALFTTLLAIITYSTSIVFINYIHSAFFSNVNEGIFTIVVLVLGIFWSGVLAFIAAGFIIKPLQKLEKAAIQASHGDIHQDVDLSTSDDEIRSLGIAFNSMLQNLREMVHSVDDNFRSTNDHVIEISQASSRASQQAEGIALTISEISAGAESSAVSIQSTAESVEDVIRIAQEVQNRSKSSEAVSTEMLNELQDSKEVVHSLVNGIVKLAKGNQDSLQAVRRLEENAKKVEQIIQLVGDIAAQTNLLALNASIEAARAGEHGKGFAVVAEEVRKLADESGKAVQGISDLIKNIQTEVGSVVGHITTQVDSANNEAEKGEKTNTVIEDMTKTIHKVASAVKEISTLVDQQMESIQLTSQQSQEVAAIAEQTSAGAEEVTEATKEQAVVMENVERLALNLQAQAEKLKNTITRFQL